MLSERHGVTLLYFSICLHENYDFRKHFAPYLYTLLMYGQKYRCMGKIIGSRKKATNGATHHIAIYRLIVPAFGRLGALYC